MRKNLYFSIFFIVSLISYSEIKLKIHEPIRFENINTSLSKDVIVGKGSIEIYTDNLEEDYGKKIAIKFPETGLMTNMKRWLKIEKFMVEEKDRNLIIQNERVLVDVYAFLSRKNINDGRMEATFIEGEYTGYLPLIVSEYSKIVNETKEKK